LKKQTQKLIQYNKRLIKMLKKTLLALITTLSIVNVASAEVTYLTAGKMLDVESGNLITKPLLVIEDGKIIKVTKQGKEIIPRNAKHIALPKMTLLPGLMDMHVHLTFSPQRFGYQGLGVSVPRATLYGAKHAKSTIEAGFTTVRNLGAFGYSDVALRDAINDGDIIGPRMLASGPPLGITGGHCDNNLLPSHYNVKSNGIADGPWAAIAKVREIIKYGADTIKLCATGGVMSKGTKVGVQQYTQIEMAAIVDEAHRHGLVVAAHAHGTDGIKTAIKAGVDSIEHASFLDPEAIALAKEHGTFLSMDVYVSDYILTESINNGVLPESIEKEKITGKRQRDSFSNAVSAGVKIVFGTDAAIFAHGNNAKQFSAMTKYGMTSLQAIQSATINAAQLINKPNALGQLKTGYLADIIAVEGNPLTNIEILESVEFVMKEGQIISGSSNKGTCE
jgi:imidazolonepropionase-like amidohydrolase